MGDGISSPFNFQGMSPKLWLAGETRSFTGINSIKGRGTGQREEARVLEPTAPTRGLNPSCRICKRRFPLSTEVRARGEHTRGEQTVSSALGASSREVSSPLSFPKPSEPLVIFPSPFIGACQGTWQEFHPWVRKIPWRRKWQPTPVFLPGASNGQRSLAGHSPWGHRVGRNWVTKTTFIEKRITARVATTPQVCHDGYASQFSEAIYIKEKFILFLFS